MIAAWLLVLPLALDTFAVSAALGLQRLPPRDRWRITALFTAFEGGMPLLGALAGGLFGRIAGDWSHWIAVVVLAGAGLLMLLGRDDDEGRIARIAQSHGPVQLLLGLSISLDELAIGFSAGLLRLPLLAVCLVVALQAAVATQLGLRLGHAVGEELRENAERAAGVALLALALLFVFIH